MMSWLLHKAQFRIFRDEIKNLKDEQEKATRRSELLEHRLNDTRMHVIATQVTSAGSSFSGEAIVRKRHPTLSDDCRLAPGSGKIAARFILQQDDLAEAERVLNTFESQSDRIDEAYPHAAFATKLVEKDEMMEAHYALRRIPDSAQGQVDEAIRWALSELGEE